MIKLQNFHYLSLHLNYFALKFMSYLIFSLTFELNRIIYTF